jgi:hypothetical protein
LWEGESPISGVAFRVEARHLEHTLTRDNVSRDRHFDAVMAVIGAAVPRFDEAVHREAEEAAAARDLPRVRRLFQEIGDVPWDWSEDRRILPGRDRPIALRELRRRSWLGGLLGEEVPVPWGSGPPPVLLADAADDPHVQFACAIVGGAPVETRGG